MEQYDFDFENYETPVLSGTYLERKAQLADFACEWQWWQSEQSLYMSEVAFWADLFRKLGKRYGLIKEFKENGII